MFERKCDADLTLFFNGTEMSWCRTVLLPNCLVSMFYAQCDNIGSMYKLAVKVIDDVNSACAGSHLYSHGIYFHSAIVSILDCGDEY